MLYTEDAVLKMYVKPNTELGFIGSNEINDVIDSEEHTDIKNDLEVLYKGEFQKCYTFEEAVKLAGHGKFHYFALVASGLSLIALVAELIGIGYSAPSAKCDMQFTTSQQGILNSIAFLGFVCSSHLWGFLSDTWGRHKSLRLALIGTFIFSTTSSLSVSISMLIATRFFVGFCIAGIQSSALPYLGEFHSNQTRARAITFASMCMTLSVMLMALISWAIIPMKWSFPLGVIVFSPWRFNIICISLISLLAFTFVGFLPESPKFLLSLGKESEAIDVLKRIYQTNNRVRVAASNIQYPVEIIERESVGTNLADTNFRNVAGLIWNQTWPLFTPPHLRNMLLISYLSAVLYGIAHGMNMWLPHIFNVLINYIDESVTMCDVIYSTMGAVRSNQTENGLDTNTRSMAVCFIFMFGRIGSVAGSNLIGLLITTNCTLILIIYAVTLFSCAMLCVLYLKTPNSK